jgi:hypothetical protein
LVGRGTALGDYDGDGKIDALVCNLEGPAMLLHNFTGGSNHWLEVRLKGPTGNSRGLGARVTVTTSTRALTREVRTCGSVLSSSAPVAHFGLGGEALVTRLVVRWPDGKESVRRSVPADQLIEVVAGQRS